MHGTPPTPVTDMNTEIVFVGSATIQDLLGKDLSGKIALVEVDLEVVPWYTEAADQCQRRGAAAVVFFNKSYFGKPPNGEAFWVINLNGAKMHIPILNTPVNDGRRLKAMILAAKNQAIPGTLISHVDIIAEGKGKISSGRSGEAGIPTSTSSYQPIRTPISTAFRTTPFPWGC